MNKTNKTPAASEFARVIGGDIITGQWCKLDDGSFGFESRYAALCADVTERRLGIVGKLVQITSKAGRFDTVRLTGVSKDYGAEDCCQWTCERI
jgi:hypothetical protein